MKKFIIIAMLTAIMPLAAMAQHEEDTENGVVSLAGRDGFTIETKKGDFVFKPYLLVQTSANFNWYEPTPVFPFLTLYSGSPERLSIKCLSTFPSMRQPAEAHYFNRHGLMFS